MITRAGHPFTKEGMNALNELCRRYRSPIRSFVRASGFSAEDAEDMTQGFLQQLSASNDIAIVDPSRGRFRNWLCRCIKNYVANERDRIRAQKRGGGCLHEYIDASGSEPIARSLPSNTPSAEEIYEHTFTISFIDRVLVQLQRYYHENGEGKLFDALRPRLVDDDAPEHKHVAHTLGMSVDATKTALSRMRSRFKQFARREARSLVNHESEVDDELKSMMASLQHVKQ
ncbi:RNA polymerase sigma factor [Sorangium sp. So ce385]|uniref:RNA polymerase sigma factor n=1 Tax=Sorangium sp. So ce385 TaxID=3133308 RepID=UPI003F5C8676